VTLIQSLPRLLDKRRFTGANLTGYHEDPLLLHQPMYHLRNRSAADVGAEKRLQVRGQGEWCGGDIEKTFIHGICSEKLRDTDGNQILTKI
jgi:hypothetical protein